MGLRAHRTFACTCNHGRVPHRKPPSDADLALSQALAEHGLNDPPDRFDAWRRAGVLPHRSAQSRGTGGGSGTTTECTPEEVEQALSVHQRLASGVKLRHLPLILFYDGFDIAEAPLLRCMAGILAELRAAPAKAAEKVGPTLHKDDAAESIAIAVAAHPKGDLLRGVASRLDQAPEAVEDLTGLLSAVVTLIFSGEEPTAPALSTLLTGLGQDQYQDDWAALSILRLISLDQLDSCLADADLADLVEARDFLRAHMQRVEDQQSHHPDRDNPAMSLTDLPIQSLAMGILIPLRLRQYLGRPTRNP